jgi:hypothetical protein
LNKAQTKSHSSFPGCDDTPLEHHKLNPNSQLFQHLTTLDFACLLAGMKDFHILVAVGKPNEGEGQKWNDWIAFLKSLRDNPQQKAKGENLLDNVWRFRGPSELRSAFRLLATAESKGQTPKLFLINEGEIVECR